MRTNGFNKFISVILSIIMVLSLVSAPSPVYSSDKNSKKEIVSGDISVSGAMSDDAVLTAEKLPDPFAAPVKKTRSTKSSGSSGQSARSDGPLSGLTFREFYDIKLEGAEGDDYEVTIGGLDLSSRPSGSVISILHIFDDEKALDAAISDGRAFPVIDADLINAFGTEAELGDKHFGEPCVYVELIKPQTVSNDSVTFRTGSFSIFAVADSPEAEDIGWKRITNTEDILRYSSEGILISHVNGYYFTGTLENVGNTANRKGIKKTAVISSPDSAEIGGAVRYYFEPAGSSGNMFYVYCGSDERQYIKLDIGTRSLLFVSSQAEATAFTAEMNTGFENVFTFRAGAWYWNMQGGINGKVFAAYNSTSDDENIRMYLYGFATVKEDDPYKLDGKSYAIISERSGTSGAAMMAEEKVVESSGSSRTLLKSQTAVIKADPLDSDGKLYVAKDSDITQWTFHNIEKDKYYLTADVDGSTKYVRIFGSSVTLADAPDEYCALQVLPGKYGYAGRIRFLGTSNAINYSSNASGFGGYNDGGNNEYFKLAVPSVFTEEDFVSHSARKISVSDAVNGAQVVIYTRVWDESTKSYGYYLIDHKGDLVRGYESGDDIVWIGTKINTLPYTFTEYYYEGTTNPNYYFDLQNTYSGKYLAPQIADGRVFTDEAAGVNLNGRRYGDYHTSILMWDDPHYDYAGLKAENGKIVSVPMSQAGQFYFALVQPPEELHTVNTVDHTQYGVTVKIKDYDGNSYQNELLGASSGTSGTPATKGLLSDCFGDDGYPVASYSGQSLAALFDDAEEVNHLFLESTYYGSGYYEFDSLQNFASLQEDGNFKVYQELGTIDIKHTTTLDHGQFMPFNDLTPGLISEKHPQNLRDALNRVLSDDDPRKGEPLYSIPGNEADYYFGVEIDAGFVQPDSGKDAWGHDIIFEFTGDDDFWLYVDGELVIDLGGVHGALPGSVNFSTGEVVVEGKKTSLYNIYKGHYVDREGVSEDDPSVAEYLDGIFELKDGNYVFRDFTTHRMRIFFMERGAGASNLRMRFNLAAVNPDEVHLSKQISGTDKYDYSSSRFPFQIRYRKNGEEILLEPDPTLADPVTVKLLNSSEDVDFRRSYEAGGTNYSNVFFLKPGQTAVIKFPKDIETYSITECAVSTDIYNEVSVNGHEVSGSSSGAGTMDFVSGWESIEDRTKITFTNHVDPGSLRSLTITKKLYDTEGNFISAEDDPTGFLIRIYLGEDRDYYRAGAYYVKDPDGNYCRYDNGFISLNKTDFSQLTDEERSSATYITSFSGAADKIPSGYSIEIRDLLVGTWFQVVENDYDTPVGYGLSSYERVEGTYIVEDGDTVNSGFIRDNSNPKIEVRNHRGFGLRVEKEWSDADFMLSHDDIYVGIFVNGVLLEGSVHSIDSYNYTTYYFETLEEGAALDDYEVREVEQTEDGWVAVDTVSVGGKDKDGNSVTPNSYSVSVTKGGPVSSYGGEPNIRTDIILNTRAGGLEIRKTDMAGTALAGADFTISTADGSVMGTYSSGDDGRVTIAYLDPGTYLLSEIKSPSGYVALSGYISIEVSPEGISVSGEDQNYYDLNDSASVPVLTVKNMPFTLKVVKQDADSAAPLEGAVFALYKQVQGYKDYNPLEGYEELSSGSDGTVESVDETLRPGSYYLTELSAPDGYRDASEVKDLLFTISSYGVTVEQGEDYSGSLSVTEGDVLEYVITITNNRVDNILLTITKAYTDALEADASSIFRVSGSEGRELRIIIIGNGSAVIAGCKAGETYTVTEETAWSWQYVPDETEKTVVISPDGSEVVFTNSTVKDRWLADSTGAVNDSTCLGD
ncbi:MAG: hypothetical protein II725_00795 [Firmicutes bacterium]|nr:hypothetical protein [Bacillota bacterium]